MHGLSFLINIDRIINCKAKCIHGLSQKKELLSIRLIRKILFKYFKSLNLKLFNIVIFYVVYILQIKLKIKIKKCY